MNGWTTHNGKAVCLAIDNIDTDQLIPARFMSQPRVDGYAEFLLHDMRRDEKGQLKPDFILNQHPTVTILLAGKNFGSGSSREAAVYALLDSGIHVVVSESFGDIFAANAINNGVLPAQVTNDHWHVLRNCMAAPAIDCTVDLDASTISIGNEQVPFSIDATWRLKLINGWDDTDLTRQHQSQIDQYREARYQEDPWSWPTMENQLIKPQS